jgi:Family of unknown function (DUF6868)
MDIQKLILFFMWCTIINLALLVLGILVYILSPDLVYNMQGELFHITRESFNLAVYSFFSVFKIFWLVFNAVPYAALLIIRKKYQRN